MAGQGTLIERWFDEVWNKGDEAAIDALLSDRCVVHGLPYEAGDEVQGIAPYRKFYRKMRSDFTDIRVEVEEVVAQGSKLVARCLVTGTHRASQKHVAFTGITITHWDGGKIVEAWNNFDFHKVEQQLAG